MVGALKVLGALGVILSLANGIAPVFTAVAALCLAVVQVVATVIDVRLKDTTSLPVNVILLLLLLLLAIAVAVLRFATP